MYDVIFSIFDVIFNDIYLILMSRYLNYTLLSIYVQVVGSIFDILISYFLLINFISLIILYSITFMPHARKEFFLYLSNFLISMMYE